MGGIPLMNLGAMPAMASPAAGIPKVSVLGQLGQEAGQLPVEMQKMDQARNTTALQKEQLASIQRKTVQDRFDRNVQLIKNNNALAKSPAMVQAIKSDAATLGLVPPTTTGAQSVASPLPAAKLAGDAAATPPGGSAAPGGATPSGQVQDDGYYGAAPAGPGGGAATPGAPAAPAQDPHMMGGAGGSAAPQGDGESVDLQAIAPRAKFQDWALAPGNVKEAYLLSPEQRRATWGSIFHDAPESFFTAPQTYGGAQQAADTTARMIAVQTLKNGDPTSITAMMKGIAPMLKADPTLDPSNFIGSAFWTNYNSVQKQKLDLQAKAGILSQKTLEMRSRKIDSDIQLGQSRIGLTQLEMQQKQIQNTYLPEKLSQGIQKAAHDMEISTQNATTRAGELKQKIAQGNLTDLARTRADAIRIRGQLQQNVNSLRGQMNGITANGLDQTAATGPDGKPSTIGAVMAQKIIDAETARDSINTSIKDSNNPTLRTNAVTNALPGAAAAHPAAVPASATMSGFFGPNNIPVYADPHTNKVYDAKTGKALN